MARKRHTAEQIIGKLRTAEIELAKGLGAGAGSSGRALCGTRGSELSAQRQWQRVHRDRSAGVARTRGRGDALYRAGKPLGERIRGVLQRKTSRRVAERRDLLHAPGSPGHPRVLASGVQHVPSPQLAGLSPTGTRDGPMAALAERRKFIGFTNIGIGTTNWGGSVAVMFLAKHTNAISRYLS
jgi:hypothetical protein